MGNYLTSKCKIDDNVLDRQSKGFGYCNEILLILKEITFGRHYFDIALTLRNAKLINGMLSSIESLYGLTITHIEQLEKVDKFFFKKMFIAVSSTPIEAYYLETGALPLRFIVIARRLMFLWSILQKKEDELVRQVFNAQQLKPVKGNWWLQVVGDMKYLKINLNVLEISNMKKQKFKNIVKTATREVAQ